MPWRELLKTTLTTAHRDPVQVVVISFVPQKVEKQLLIVFVVVAAVRV